MDFGDCRDRYAIHTYIYMCTVGDILYTTGKVSLLRPAPWRELRKTARTHNIIYTTRGIQSKCVKSSFGEQLLLLLCFRPFQRDFYNMDRRRPMVLNNSILECT